MLGRDTTQGIILHNPVLDKISVSLVGVYFRRVCGDVGLCGIAVLLGANVGIDRAVAACCLLAGEKRPDQKVETLLAGLCPGLRLRRDAQHFPDVDQAWAGQLTGGAVGAGNRLVCLDQAAEGDAEGLRYIG